MDNIIVPTAPAVKVGAKSPIERKTVSPFGSQQPGSKRLPRCSPFTKSVLEVELAEMDKTWSESRLHYLASVFGIVIFCTADPDIEDAKRYAAQAKAPGQRLKFVNSSGGLNECARRFARGAEAGLKSLSRGSDCE
jgi:hypothetical protein